MADLKSEGTLPVLRETLKIVVMGVIRISMFCLRIEVGMGSKSHVFVPDDDTMFLTRVSFTGEKQSKIAPLYGLNSGSKLLMSRSSLMFCTYLGVLLLECHLAKWDRSSYHRDR